jgi:hypothetical protein
MSDLGQRLAVLLQGQFVLPLCDIWSILPPALAQLYILCALACIIFFAWGVWPVLQRERTICFFSAGMLCAAVPFCSTLPSNRFLFFTGLGCMGLIARFLSISLEQPPWFIPYWRRPRKIVAGIFIFNWLLISPLLFVLLTLSPLAVQKPLRIAAETIAPARTASFPERIVVINAPSDLILFYLPFIRAASMHDNCPRTFLLTAGLMPVDVERIDACTLVTRPAGGLLAATWNQVSGMLLRHTKRAMP